MRRRIHDRRNIGLPGLPGLPHVLPVTWYIFLAEGTPKPKVAGREASNIVGVLTLAFGNCM